MKIAVVGSGIAGNVAASRLARDHDITVFEAADRVGGHTNTIDVTHEGHTYGIDTGFIVFNDRTYPHFVALLDELGVVSHESEMSFSVRNERSGLEYNGSTLSALFAQRRNLLRPAFHRMLWDILRFNREAPELLAAGSVDLTLGDFLARQRYSRTFIENYIVPMGAAIWSAPPCAVRQMPAKFFVSFFDNHGMLTVNDRPKWRVISGGSRNYVEKLVAPYRDRIRLNSRVESIRRRPNYVEIRTRGAAPERFDHVFIACHSDEALAILSDASPLEREVLGAIKYQTNEAVLHTDERVMPRRQRAWAAWNYHIAAANPERVTVTYNMNILQGIEAAPQFCVSLNCPDVVDPSRIIQRIRYAHPLFSREAVIAQGRQAELNGRSRTYFCGAYWRCGFHEDGVVSALNALKHFQNREAYAERNLRRTG